MSGLAKTLCSTCGIPTRYDDGTCRDCRTAKRRPCLMCSTITGNTDRVCSNCAAYIRDAERHIDDPALALVGGRWVPARGIKVWQEAS